MPQETAFSQPLTELDTLNKTITLGFQSRSDYIKKQKFTNYSLGNTFHLQSETCLKYPITVEAVYADKLFFFKWYIEFSSDRNLDQIQSFIEQKLEEKSLDFTTMLTYEGYNEVRKIVELAEIKFSNNSNSLNKHKYHFSEDIIKLGFNDLSFFGPGKIEGITNREQEGIARKILDLVSKTQSELSEEQAQKLGRTKMSKNKDPYSAYGNVLSYSYVDMKELFE